MHQFETGLSLAETARQVNPARPAVNTVNVVNVKYRWAEMIDCSAAPDPDRATAIASLCKLLQRTRLRATRQTEGAQPTGSNQDDSERREHGERKMPTDGNTPWFGPGSSEWIWRTARLRIGRKVPWNLN
jgi:hypothetical protein